MILVQDIVNTVSYLGEFNDPSVIQQVITRFPELGPVLNVKKCNP